MILGKVFLHCLKSGCMDSLFGLFEASTLSATREQES